MHTDHTGKAVAEAAERRVFHRANQAAEGRAQETSGTSDDLRN